MDATQQIKSVKFQDQLSARIFDINDLSPHRSLMMGEISMAKRLLLTI
jgi:hypothetical protein